MLKINIKKLEIHLHESKKLKPRQKPRLVFKINYCGVTFTGKNLMFTLHANKTAQLTITGRDAAGSEEPVENIVLASSDESIVTVDQSGLVTWIAPGSATISATGDALIGIGEIVVVGSLEVVAAAPEQPLAETLELTATEI